MTREDAAFIGCRLLAVFFALKGIPLLASAAFSILIDRPEFPKASPSIIGLFVIQLTAVVLVPLGLWFGAGRISRYLLPDRTPEASAEPITSQSLQAALFAAVGLYIFVLALPELAGSFYRLRWTAHWSSQSEGPVREWSHLLECSLRTVLGLILLLRARGISAFVQNLRGGPTEKAEPPG